ncbi:drug/metabolite transporter (DMT)-like permease [Clostridium tetanomorphum]|uniref:DMT family transporter n=2 Tax=Clostridium tetanomorphum TaxID=1553 RepID=UPI000453A314|nr:DMT family transporter [Clostridium tetanomorphum]KAJ52585.1 membrane spanning protein [Clostridium tetanomorphum DSM 665]MBP1863177.1 drug/metabolite transporter (DMT)-like permease [Clostridium tetanomorphum]NRS84285.1 drug/metabolite transporter (DMT)-like permease [Clostridium tetanomorphum]
MKNKKTAHFLAILLMIIWGISFISIKVVVGEINPIQAAFYRFFMASIILFIVLKTKFPEERILKEDRIKMVLSGLIGVAMYFFFENYSVYYTTASNVAVLISSIPIFTLITQRILFKEKLTMPKIFGTMFSAIGIFIIVLSKGKISLFSSGTKGDLMALGAALCWVLYTILTSSFKGSYKSITITTYQSIWGCVFLSPSILFMPVHVPSMKVIANLLYLAIICSCVGYAIYIYCLENLGATTITTHINLQPIVSLIGAKILLNENVALEQVIGCLIIILGVSIVSFGEKINLKALGEYFNS